MSTTKNLNLKLLKYNQAQKEILINEAICLFDSLIHRSAISFTKDPPSDKTEGDVYIVPSNSKHSWEGAENSIAVYLNGWRYIQPKEGWIFWVNSRNQYYVYKNDSWQAQANQTKHIEQNSEEIILDLDQYQKYQLFLDRDTNFQLKSNYEENHKVEFLIYSKGDIKINWPDNIRWNDKKIDIMSKNSYLFVEIYRVNNLFLGKNTSL